MVVALADRVARDLDLRDLAPLTPWQPTRRPWGAALVVAAIWGTAVLLFGDALERGIHGLYPNPIGLDEQFTGPLVGDLAIELLYPEYTGREIRIISNSSGDVEAPKGTRVHIGATTLGPSKQCAATFGPRDSPTSTAQMALAANRDVTGEFVISEAAPWRFTVVDAKGASLTESIERRIRIELDEPPQVSLKFPAEDLELDDPRDLEVVWEATDDYGLMKANIILGLAGDDEANAIRREQHGVKGARFRGEDDVDLSAIDAQPGDRLALTVEVFDNNGIDGPQRGVSATRYITIHSPEAKHFELSQKLRDVVEALLLALADRLEASFRGPGVKLDEFVHALIETTDRAIRNLDEIVLAMADDPLTPDEVRLALLGRLGELQEAATAESDQTQRIAQIMRDSPASVIGPVSKTNERVVEQLEQTIILVEAMVARLAIEDMMAMTEQLQAAKEKLRDLVKQYRDKPSDALKARIMREISRLRDRMREIRERMAQLRQKLPEEFLNLDGLKNDEVAKGLEGAEKQLDSLEKMLDEGRIDDALAAIEEMAAALDEITQALDQDFQELHEQTNPELQKALNELMDQTRDLMNQQDELAKETEKLAKEAQMAQQKLLEEVFKEQLDQIKADAQALRKMAEEIDGDTLRQFAREELGNLQQRADDLNGALDRDALMEALEMGERASDNLNVLDRAARSQPGGTTGGNLESIGEGQATAQRIVRDLAELIENARAQMQMAGSPGGGAKFPQMSQEQGQLAQKADRLRQQVREKRDSVVPNMPADPEQRAGRAADAMQQASRQLGRGQPGQAVPGQQQAMSELKGLMEGLKQSLQPQKANRSQQDGQRGVKRDKVRIPDADEYQAPEAFRRELLDAMKDDAPENYRELVKRYYRSLVR